MNERTNHDEALTATAAASPLPAGWAWRRLHGENEPLAVPPAHLLADGDDTALGALAGPAKSYGERLVTYLR